MLSTIFHCFKQPVSVFQLKNNLRHLKNCNHIQILQRKNCPISTPWKLDDTRRKFLHVWKLNLTSSSAGAHNTCLQTTGPERSRWCIYSNTVVVCFYRLDAFVAVAVETVWGNGMESAGALRVEAIQKDFWALFSKHSQMIVEQVRTFF